MNITRYQPWSIVGTGALRNPAAQWVPSVDIIDEESRFLLRADVPGVDLADIDVSMDGNVLTVSGVRHAEKRDADSSTRRIERSTGRFLRRFTLPETADAEHITAKSSNGVLEVVIPKLEEIQARRITVEAA